MLVEKLLRCCPDLGKVYILLRPKNGMTPEQRVEKQFIDCKVFSGLASSLVAEKIHPLSGELHVTNLGLDEKSQQLLFDSVQVVFHVAASVRFDDPLRQCMRENVEGTKHVLELCHRMTQLESLVHVSTAYAYCHQDRTEERLYPIKVKPHQLIDLCSWMDEKSLELGCAKLFEGRPNTYTFTKAVAEHYVDQNRGELPIAIARPSIVTGSKKDPIVGWVDSINGPGGATLLGTLGIARTMKCCPNITADLIPVDTVANALIAIAWQTGRRSSSPTDSIPIYNITSGTVNPTSWEKYLEYGREIAMAKPSIRAVRVPASVPRGTKVNLFGHYLTRFFSETLFAYMMDFLIILFGHKPL